MIHAEVCPPHLGEFEIRVGHVQLKAVRALSGDVGRLVASRIRAEWVDARIAARLEARDFPDQHTGVAQLIRDPDIERRTSERAGAHPQLCALLTGDIPVHRHARRPQDLRIGHLAGFELHRVPVLIAEGQGVGLGVLIRGVLERRDVEPEATGDREISPRPPLVLNVAAGVPHVERLKRLIEVRHIRVPDLEAAQRAWNGGRPIRVRRSRAGFSVEVSQRIEGVVALRAATPEDVVRVVFLRRETKGQCVTCGELQEAVLQLERVIPELVLNSKWLGAERDIRRVVLQDVNEGEQITERPSALVVRGVAGNQAV